MIKSEIGTAQPANERHTDSQDGHRRELDTMNTHRRALEGHRMWLEGV